MRLTPLFLLVSSLALGACGSPPMAFAPAQTSNADLAGTPATSYAIPPEAPCGELLVGMLGVAALTPQRGLEDTPPRAVRLALVVSNRCEEVWSVDRTEARIDLSSPTECRSIYAASDGLPAAQTIEIAPHSTKWIDLYFELPPGRELPAFDAVWVVHAGERRVIGRTPFERRPITKATPAPSTRFQDTAPLPGSEPPERRESTDPTP